MHIDYAHIAREIIMISDLHDPPKRGTPLDASLLVLEEIRNQLVAHISEIEVKGLNNLLLPVKTLEDLSEAGQERANAQTYVRWADMLIVRLQSEGGT